MQENKKIIVILEEGADYFVLFPNEQGEIVKGIVPASMIPLDYETRESFDLNSWESHIKGKVKYKPEEVTSKDALLKKAEKCDKLCYIDGMYYRNNTNVSLPESVLNAYIKFDEMQADITALDKFWYWACQNEPHIRDMLFNWLGKDEWSITDEGMIITYRNVNSLSSYSVFYGERYESFNKVLKTIYNDLVTQKINPELVYLTISDNSVGVTKNQTEINVSQFYHSMEDIYTHDYKGTNRHFYRFLKESVMNRSETDTSGATCSKGFHLMSKTYNENNPGYYGSITICCLVNPANIVSCPREASYNKMRTCAFLPVCRVEKDSNGKIIPPDETTISKASIMYHKVSSQDLEEFKNQSLFDPNPKFMGRTKNSIREIIFEL